MTPRHDSDCVVPKKSSVRLYSRCEIDTQKLLKFALENHEFPDILVSNRLFTIGLQRLET